MNYTPNYQLNQWEADDRVQRVDFNADNSKIDSALAGLPVELRRVKLTGAAKKISLSLTAAERAKFPRLKVVCPQLNFVTGQVGLQVNGLTSGYMKQSAGSMGESTSGAYATVGGYGTAAASETLIFPFAGGIALFSDSVSLYAPKISAIWNKCFVSALAYSQITSLEVVCEKTTDNLLAGSEAILYGLRA